MGDTFEITGPGFYVCRDGVAAEIIAATGGQTYVWRGKRRDSPSMLTWARGGAYHTFDLNDLDIVGPWVEPEIATVTFTDVDNLQTEIYVELKRARELFPGDNVTLAALMEEVGELAKASFEEPRANVRKEAVQVAVMAMRMVLDGDHTLDNWRETKGLDALVAPAE